jgi:DNA uptake protein ComE-like DNA-binding protein
MNICARSVKFTNIAVLLVCFALIWSSDGANADETAPAEEAASSAMVVVNPNFAGADELGALPGMSKELVDAIMEQRPFLGMVALHPVVTQHLDQEAAEKLYVQMFIPINLNTASEEEILLVPGDLYSASA